MGRVPTRALQGKHAATVLAKYEAYLKDPSIAKQSHPVTDRPKSEKLYLDPFGLTLPAHTYAIASASNSVITKYLDSVNTGGTRAKQEITTTGSNPEIALKLQGYRAARVVIRTGRSKTGTSVNSKTSGMPYKYYGGKSVSIPFGIQGTTETQEQAFQVIQAKIAPPKGADNPLVTLLKEQISGY